MPFMTQRVLTQQDTLVVPSGERRSIVLGRSGYYARIRISCTGEIGTLVGAAPNTWPVNFGNAALIKEVRLRSNFTRDLKRWSGEGYYYLVAPRQGDGAYPFPGSNALNAIAPGPINLPMLIDICVNKRDSLGTIVGGNQESQFTLEITRRTDAELNIATWVTQPVWKVELEWFEGSNNPALQPTANYIFQTLEETWPIPGQGVFRIPWERGGQVLGMHYGIGFGEIDTPSSVRGWDDHTHRYNQSLNVTSQRDPEFDAMDPGLELNQEYLPGTFAYNYAAQAGLWKYDQFRDMVLTDDVVDNNELITINAAGVTFGNVYVIREQLVPVVQPGAPGQGGSYAMKGG